MNKTISIDNKDRLELLKYVNILREFNCNTSEKIAIYYEHVFELESLMYRLSNILEFQQPKGLEGGWYADYQLKENLPEAFLFNPGDVKSVIKYIDTILGNGFPLINNEHFIEKFSRENIMNDMLGSILSSYNKKD